MELSIVSPVKEVEPLPEEKRNYLLLFTLNDEDKKIFFMYGEDNTNLYEAKELHNLFAKSYNDHMEKTGIALSVPLQRSIKLFQAIHAYQEFNEMS